MVGPGGWGGITLSSLVRLDGSCLIFMDFLHGVLSLHSVFLFFFCSYIANQKRLEIINEDDLEAYVGLKNL